MYPYNFLPDFGPSSGEDLLQKWCNFCFCILLLCKSVFTVLMLFLQSVFCLFTKSHLYSKVLLYLWAAGSSLIQISLNIIDIFCLNIFFWIRSYCRIFLIIYIYIYIYIYSCVYIYIYIYIYIYVCVCVCVCVCVLMRVNSSIRQICFNLLWCIYNITVLLQISPYNNQYQHRFYNKGFLKNRVLKPYAHTTSPNTLDV